jgi:hypothetical protein
MDAQDQADTTSDTKKRKIGKNQARKNVEKILLTLTKISLPILIKSQ